MENSSKSAIWILEGNKDQQLIYSGIFLDIHPIKFFNSLSELQLAISENDVRNCKLLIADLMLPDGFFLEFLNQPIISISFPFIIASSIHDIDVMRIAFAKGASDYLVRPIDESELITKIEKVLSENKTDKNEHYRKILDLRSRNSEYKNLTFKEAHILSILLSSPTQSISREDLLLEVWKTTTVHPKTIDVHIHNLRKKIKPHGIQISSGERVKLFSPSNKTTVRYEL